MHVNISSDDEMQLAITINNMTVTLEHEFTREHINVGFRSRGGGGGCISYEYPVTNSSSSRSFLFWRRESVFVQNGFVH